MDMSASYIPAAEEYLPDIDIVFDRFHVMALMNKAIDKVRRHQCKKLNKEEKKAVKGKRFLLLKNYSSLSEKQVDQVNSLFSANIPLFQAHSLKEQLRLFWDMDDSSKAAKFLLDWIDGARFTKLKPLITVANTLETHFHALLNYYKHKISNGKAEGVNNKIKTLKRQSYGFRDNEYFKLRLYHLHAQKYKLCG